MAVVALGTFDGVHAGHRALIASACALAREMGEEAVVHTFQNHPRGVFAQQPRLLLRDEARLGLLRTLCPSVMAEAFTPQYAALSPEAFMRRLMDTLAMTVAVSGENYTFGAGGAGGVDTMAALGRKLGFQVVTAPSVTYAGEVISSTRIRACLEAGEVSAAASMLTRPYALCGRIRENRGIGRKLGFPTANIACDPMLVTPAEGVYASRATVDGTAYNAVTNVGCNPTVGGRELSVETHLLDFSGDLYTRKMEVCFVERLRGEIRFADVEALKAQVALDKAQAREILRKNG